MARRAAGAGTQAAGFAALSLYVRQAATAEQAEGLTEAKRKPITNTNGSCVSDRKGKREVTQRSDTDSVQLHNYRMDHKHCESPVSL